MFPNADDRFFVWTAGRCVAHCGRQNLVDGRFARENEQSIAAFDPAQIQIQEATNPELAPAIFFPPQFGERTIFTHVIQRIVLPHQGTDSIAGRGDAGNPIEYKSEPFVSGRITLM